MTVTCCLPSVDCEQSSVLVLHVETLSQFYQISHGLLALGPIVGDSPFDGGPGDACNSTQDSARHSAKNGTNSSGGGGLERTDAKIDTSLTEFCTNFLVGRLEHFLHYSLNLAFL